MPLMSKVLMVAGMLAVLSGCAMNTRDEPASVQIDRLGPEAMQQMEQLVASRQEAAVRRGEAVGYPAPLHAVESSAQGYDPVSEAVHQMAQQLARGLDENRVRRLPLAVLRFHDLMQREHAGPLGERLGDSFIVQLEHLGYNLVDYRAVSLTTTQKQEPDPSSLSLLRSRNRIYFVLTGTYAQHPDGVVINARVLDTTTRQVLASAQTHIPTARLEGAWPGYDPLKAAADGMIIENRYGPAGMNP